MQVSKISESGLSHEFSIVLPGGEIEHRLDAKLSELQPQVQLKGFRPGKVPMAHLKRVMSKQVLGEVIETAVNESSEQVLREQALVAAIKPKIRITKFEEGGDLEYAMTVDVMPPIPALDAQSIKLERLVVEVTDADIDQGIERLARNNRTFDETEAGTEAAAGDQVVIDFKGTVDGIAFDGGTASDFSLELGSGQFIPGFEDQLIGAKAGEERVVQVTFPEEYGVATLAGKAAEFAVTVHAVKRALAQSYDDSFARKFNFETIEALREAVRAQIAQDYRKASRSRLKRSLLDELDKMYSFELPPSLVEAESEQIWAQIRQQMPASEQGEPIPGADPVENLPSEQERAEFRRIAERRVRLGLLLAEVGRLNQVQVAQEDVNRAIVEQAKRYPGQERQVFDFYNKNPAAVSELRAPLFEEKVVDFILELADIGERVVSVEELMREPDLDEPAASPNLS